jgi:hypothetical protein
MIMCHMVADSILDLFEMAEKIGMRAEWFQPRSFPHFDVSLTRRTLAISNSAQVIDRRKIVHVKRAYRLRLENDAAERAALTKLTAQPCYLLAANLRAAKAK